MSDELGQEVPKEVPSPLEVPVPKIEDTKVEEKDPASKMVEVLKDYSFLQYSNGVIIVNHEECKETLELKLLKMGDLARRGTILANLNGGVKNTDDSTASLNGCLATVQVGFTSIKLNTLNVMDTNLILGLYTAIISYNSFFRKTPLGFIL